MSLGNLLMKLDSSCEARAIRPRQHRDHLAPDARKVRSEHLGRRDCKAQLEDRDPLVGKAKVAECRTHLAAVG